ncbi:MAG TPA: CsgE family curli-type amyloid fiber assembly protein [Rhodothermales bacterium]
MIRAILNLFLFFASIDGLAAQPREALLPAAPRTESIPGYDAILREYRQLRRVEEAGIVGGNQDGLERPALDGLVVDETQTKLARDFYAEFYTFWQAPEGAMNYTVVVGEQPVPNVGTRVLVRVNDEIAFQAHLQPRGEVVQETARQAVYVTYRFVQSLSSREAYVY